MNKYVGKNSLIKTELTKVMSLTYSEDSQHDENNFILVVVWFYLIALVAYGAYGFYQLVFADPEVGEAISDLFNIGQDFFSENWRFIIFTIFSIFAVIILLAVIQIYLLSYIGAELVVGIVFGFPTIMIVLGLIFIDSGGLILLIIGGIFGLIAYFFRKQLIFGAKFFEFSTEVVVQNFKTLIPMIGVAMLNMLLGFMYFGAASYTYFIFYDPNSDTVSQVALSLVSLAYIVGQSMIRYFAEAINVSIFYRWYRDIPQRSVSDGLADAMKVKTTVLAFGALIGFITWLRRVIRDAKQSSRGRGGGVEIIMMAIRSVLFVSDFMLRIFEFMTYYTLPIIVIEKKSLSDSVQRSGNVISRTLGKVIGGNIGMGVASFFYNIINFLLLMIIGSYFGYNYAYDQLLAGSGIDEDSARFGLAVLMAVIFLIFGYYPLSILFTPIRTAFSTLLFIYFADKQDGKTAPSKISPDLQEHLDGITAKEEYTDAKDKSTTQYADIYKSNY
ncbi:MAG: CTL/SLC44 family protein [Candidatus Heimdallarchaeota archaeon]|nr:CTL/SLC44 family protein [Candidatus Heimdallarchaeota archaeon]